MIIVAPVQTSILRDGTYVNILDGVAGFMQLTNQAPGGARAYNSSSKKVLTKAVSSEGVLLVEPIVGWLQADWHKTATDVTVSGTAPAYTVKVAYSGSALPAMVNGMTPAGWSFTQQPWEVWDSGIQTGYVDTHAVGMHPGNGCTIYAIPQPRLYFVPNFLFAAASTTPTLTDGVNQTWSLYLLKPLGCNQSPTITVTTSMFGGTTTLATTPVYDAYHQLIRLDVAVPLVTQHPSQASNTIRVQAPMTLRYLKGDTIVTETLPYDQTFNVSVSSGADTTPPVISGFHLLTPVDLSGDADAARMCYGTYNGITHVGGLVVTTCTASDSALAGGLDRAELWATIVNVSGGAIAIPPTKVTTTIFSGAKGPVTFRTKWDTRVVPAGSGTAPVSITMKVYDMSGNVSTSSLGYVYIGNVMAVGSAGISGVAYGSTSYSDAYDGFVMRSVTGWQATIAMAPIFVSSVKFMFAGAVADPNTLMSTDATTTWDVQKGVSTTYSCRCSTKSYAANTSIGVQVTDTTGNVVLAGALVRIIPYSGGGGKPYDPVVMTDDANKDVDQI